MKIIGTIVKYVNADASLVKMDVMDAMDVVVKMGCLVKMDVMDTQV